jgi:UDP-glucose 4-epimerase
MNKIVVTGAGGFIGRALVRDLATNPSNEVWALDNNFRGSLKSISERPNLVFQECDVCNYNDVIKVLKGASIVFHLAAINGTRNFYDIPERVLEVGIIGTHNVTKACTELDINHLVFASSSEVYQKPKQVPTTEEENCRVPEINNPRLSYGGSKIAGELIVHNYLRNYNTSFTIFRPHNVFGPEMGFDHVIPELIKKIFKASNGKRQTGEKIEIEIEGDGSETRSFVYIDDTIDAINLCTNTGEKNNIFNIGTEEEKTINNLLISIGDILDIDLSIKPSKVRRGSTPRRCPDTSKLRFLGFIQKTSFEQGLKKTVDWYWDYYLQYLND